MSRVLDRGGANIITPPPVHRPRRTFGAECSMDMVIFLAGFWTVQINLRRKLTVQIVISYFHYAYVS